CSFLSCTPYPPTSSSPLSLHDALPIFREARQGAGGRKGGQCGCVSFPLQRVLQRNGRGEGRNCSGLVGRCGEGAEDVFGDAGGRSEEHTSELQSRENRV